MFPALKRLLGMHKEGFTVPKSVQKSIPIETVFKDGIMKVGNVYSKTWVFSDINYAALSYDSQMEMFLGHCNNINVFPTDATTKITINNRTIDKQIFKKSILMGEKSDSLDKYREEVNNIIMDKMADSNNIMQEKYITVSVSKKNIEEARTFFARVGNDLTSSFGKLSSLVRELTISEKLRVFHDFFRNNEERQTEFNLRSAIKFGYDFKDYICPDDIEFKSDHFMLGESSTGSEKYGRVLFLKEFPSFLKDNMLSELTDFSRNLMLSVDILPISTDEAVKELQKRVLAVETDITRWQNKQNMNNNFSTTIPYELEQLRKEFKELLDDITTRDQRLMFTVVTLVHIADNLESLNADTDTLLSIGRQKLCEFSTLTYQQEDALKTVLPYGLIKIEAVRTLTTESTAVLMPFKTQEIMDKGGIYYGINAISHNLLLCNRKLLLNGNGFILGVSGSGKSFTAKMEMAEVALATNDDIIIVDPEREYSKLVSLLGGEIIRISATSNNHINALDMDKDYGDGENPIILKSEFVMSLCEQLMGTGKLGAKEKSIIDRATALVYKGYMQDYNATPPTLHDFRKELLKQPEQGAKDIALAIELFTDGSLDVFAHQTNIDANNRIILYDILDLGEQLKPIGLLVMLDSILNRVIANRKKGKYTHIYIDETHLFFANQYSSQFLAKSWKRFRKYGGLVTGITQNVEECLRSETARIMLANSEFLLMLNQAATDRMELANILNISETQMSHITNAPAGRGLLKVGAAMVPFINDFPRETELYKLMTTKPGEG